jgi:hypothetical protein
VSHAHRSIAVRLGGRLENSDEFVLSVIDRPEKKNEMLGTAAENGILEAVQLLLEVGADINSLNTRGTCSHWKGFENTVLSSRPSRIIVKSV